MPQPTCFVVMAIGDQNHAGGVVTARDLRKRYDDLILEAILKARPGMDVVRADDVAVPGSISSDILSRLMHSDFVIADISIPNANVFYELGIRNACRPGTILIKDKTFPPAPFDISHQRYLEYENTPSGVKALAKKLGEQFSWFEAHPGVPDNQFLQFAQLTRYQFQQYGDPAEKTDRLANAMADAYSAVFQFPELLSVAMNPGLSQEEKNAAMLTAIQSNPSAGRALIVSIMKASLAQKG